MAEVRDEDDEELLSPSQIWFLGIKDYLIRGVNLLGRPSEVEKGEQPC